MINILASQLDKTDLSKLIIIDVRTSEEFNEGSIPFSTNMPVETIMDSGSPNLDRSKPLLVYCESGARSQLACQILDQLGHQTYNLLGGYTAWLSQKH